MDNEEEYIPKKPKYYNYKGKNDCLLYFSDEISTFKKVNILAYKVDNSVSIPFLNILLHKPKGENTLILPELHIFKNFEPYELISYSKVYLFSLCLLDNFDDFIEKLMFNGFYIYDNKLYLFFDITNCNIRVNDIYNNSQLWFGLIDEIVNHKNICNIKIDENVTNLFALNDKLCFLNNENEESYEIPIVGFVGTSKEKVNFKSIFGESAQNKNSILGPYFYFTNFSNAFTSKGSDCIIRFALFIGKVKYIENKVDDNIDESETKQLRLKDTNLDQNLERLTMRITDHDGNWTKNYDSAYLGNVELDNGENLKDTPVIVVRYYEQQIPLGYHYINKKTLDYDNSCYSIL
jgi:hypothetical protein